MSDYERVLAELPRWDELSEEERGACEKGADALRLLREISMVARRALSFGHQATPQTSERMIAQRDEALRRIHDMTGVSGSVLRDS